MPNLHVASGVGAVDCDGGAAPRPGPIAAGMVTFRLRAEKTLLGWQSSDKKKNTLYK
jgi:hypothetical protein